MQEKGFGRAAGSATGVSTRASFESLESRVFLSVAAPTGLASNRTSVSLAPNALAKMHILEFTTNSGTGNGNRAMSIAIFDDSTTVELPVDFAPLPAGSLILKASDFDAPEFDVRDFEIDGLIDSINRIAAESIVVN